ncbi:MAG: hypothetical protein AWU54_2171 [Candidatus Frackibacter sp. T328-2]|nr:MAG: hypothetical protein AWU54_2171 [Candidatus Frackibacter sp. T328-2]
MEALLMNSLGPIILSGIVAFVVSQGYIKKAAKEGKEFVESTENEIDDVAYSSIPGVAKAVRNGLRRSGLENEDVAKLLNEIKNEVIEQDEATDEEAVKEFNKQIKEIERTEVGTGKSQKKSENIK